MNYSEKSDFEINVEVAKKYLPCDYYINQARNTVDLISMQMYLGPHGEPDEREVKYGEFNPTGSWADIGPIIEKYGIDIEWPEVHLGSVGSCKKYRRGDADIIVEFKLKSQALRTAAIVFLMMEVE